MLNLRKTRNNRIQHRKRTVQFLDGLFFPRLPDNKKGKPRSFPFFINKLQTLQFVNESDCYVTNGYHIVGVCTKTECIGCFFFIAVIFVFFDKMACVK